MDALTILFLAANPSETEPLQLAQESRRIDQALRMTKFRSRFVLEDHWAVQPQDLQELLLRHEPKIVHFSGHGAESNSIVLVDGSNQAIPVSATALRDLLSHFAETVRCVVLNACYSNEQAREIAQVIDCVVGIEDTVTDDDAIAFSAAFYRSLGYGKSIATAYSLARNEVAIFNSEHAFEPHLIATRIDPAGVYLVEPLDENVAYGGPSFHAQPGEPPVADESLPALGGMAGNAGRLMLIILALLALGLAMLVVLPFLMSS